MNHNSAGNAVVVNKPNSSSEVKDQFSPRYSITEEDNLGDPLSEQQKEYFANSKIRDEQGRLLKLYHLTSNDITHFDKSRQGENTGASNTYIGFFFIDDPSYLRGNSWCLF
jgi:hypothetical protein